MRSRNILLTHPMACIKLYVKTLYTGCKFGVFAMPLDGKLSQPADGKTCNERKAPAQTANKITILRNDLCFNLFMLSYRLG